MGLIEHDEFISINKNKKHTKVHCSLLPIQATHYLDDIKDSLLLILVRVRVGFRL
jgi:hypothetical protein